MFVPVFISGCSRSGTTLLGDLLGAHRDCLVTPESQFFLQAYLKSCREGNRSGLAAVHRSIQNNYRFRNWGLPDISAELVADTGSMAALIEAVVRSYGQDNGKTSFKYWIDHTPMTIKYAATLAELFPQAKFIHLVRDGRAVAASLLDVDWGGGTMNEFASLWMNKVGFGLAAESYLQDRITRVRFEDLVGAPEATLASVCKFIGIVFSGELLEGRGLRLPAYTQKHHALVGGRPRPDRATAWQSKLSPRQVEVFEFRCCDYLRYLGYEPLYGARARPLTKPERLGAFVTSRLSRLTNALRRRQRIRSIGE